MKMQILCIYQGLDEVTHSSTNYYQRPLKIIKLLVVVLKLKTLILIFPKLLEKLGNEGLLCNLSKMEYLAIFLQF